MLRLLSFMLLALSLQAATIRLYLKDGTYQNAREYERKPDRVRYYSSERGEWEELPLALVDLKRTEEEMRERKAAEKEEVAILDAEDKAEREQREEIERIPMQAGVFHVATSDAKPLTQAETKIVRNRRRSILKAMSPIPIVAGKSTIELDGLAAKISIAGERPEFYIRLNSEERFGIVRMTAGKKARIVQTLNIIPVTNEILEEMDTVEVFRKQLADGLYKIWPTKPIAPGEYAVIEYTEGKGNVQVWDFTLSK